VHVCGCSRSRDMPTHRSPPIGVATSLLCRAVLKAKHTVQKAARKLAKQARKEGDAPPMYHGNTLPMDTAYKTRIIRRSLACVPSHLRPNELRSRPSFRQRRPHPLACKAKVELVGWHVHHACAVCRWWWQHGCKQLPSRPL
jgi:hypothetical protein